MTDAQFRKQLEANGIIDAHQERFLMDFKREFEEKLDLQRATVDRRVWDLEDELMQERTK